MLFMLSFFLPENKIAHWPKKISLIQCRQRRSDDMREPKYYISIDDILVKVAYTPIKKCCKFAYE